MGYNSKYNGAEVEAILDRASDCITKGESVDFATDLTGVPEATPEEFTYRPSAGRKSIRDKSAVIRRIKGNSLVWNQLLRERAFTEVNVTLSYNDDGSINTINNGSLSCGITQLLVNTIPSRHKVLVVVDYKRSSLTSSNCLFYLHRKNVENFDKYSIDSIKSTERRVDGGLITTTDECDRIYVYPFLEGEEGSSATIYSVMAIDLTVMFGVGNEPVTIEEFYARIPEGVDLTAYNAGELTSMNANAIETTGFNQWDEEWEVGGINTENGKVYESSTSIRSKNFNKCVGGQTYFCKGDYALYWYDVDKSFIGKSYVKNQEVSFPLNASYFMIGFYTNYGTTYKNDICINLSHSGVRNGEYEPYEKNILLLPEIAKYFPDGMHGIGDVCDEIIDGLAIKRIGEVDLGSLDWSIRTTSDKNKYSWGAILSTPSIGADKNANILCAKYITASANDVYLLKDKTVAVLSNVLGISVNIYDSNYTAKTDKDSFVASLQGVKLYYELSEPIYTPIDEPLQLDYKVDDFGTERILSDGASAPFKADIVYQFNAEGRIRDNSRNIASLEGQILTLYQGKDTTGSIANTIERNTISFAKLTEAPNADGLIKGRDTKEYIDDAIENAEDRIDDNSRLIGSLEGRIKTLYSGSEVVGSIENKVSKAIAKEVERADAKYALPRDIASLEDYVNDELDKKVSKTDNIGANKITGVNSDTAGYAQNLPVLSAKVQSLNVNILADLKADEFYIEKTEGDGTWQTVDHTSAAVRSLFICNGLQNGFTLSPNESWPVGSQFRITIYPKTARHAWVDFFAINMYCNARYFNISAEWCDKNDGGNPTWIPTNVQVEAKTNCTVLLSYGNWFGFAAYNRWGIRFTFEVTREYKSNSRVWGIAAYSNNHAPEIHSTADNAIWTIGKDYLPDADKNATFPEKVIARSFEDRDGNAVMLAKDIPTEVATAVPREVVRNKQPATILPNRLYDWTGQTSTSIILPPLASGDNTYYNKWMVLLATSTSDELTIPFDVLWKNGVAPTWDTWCICKMIFFKDAEGYKTCGEWEIYSYGD